MRCPTVGGCWGLGSRDGRFLRRLMRRKVLSSRGQYPRSALFCRDEGSHPSAATRERMRTASSVRAILKHTAEGRGRVSVVIHQRTGQGWLLLKGIAQPLGQVLDTIPE